MSQKVKTALVGSCFLISLVTNDLKVYMKYSMRNHCYFNFGFFGTCERWLLVSHLVYNLLGIGLKLYRKINHIREETAVAVCKEKDLKWYLKRDHKHSLNSSYPQSKLGKIKNHCRKGSMPLINIGRVISRWRGKE